MEPVRFGLELVVPKREVWGQSLAGDLAGRPPQRVIRDAPLLAPAATHLGAHVARRRAGQKQPTQDRTERLRVQVGTGARGDCLGCRIGLLGGHAALLDR